MKTTEVNKELIGKALRVHFYGLNGNGRYRGHPRRPAFHSGQSLFRPPAPVGRLFSVRLGEQFVTIGRNK